jgi:hypothetical protein
MEPASTGVSRPEMKRAGSVPPEPTGRLSAADVAGNVLMAGVFAATGLTGAHLAYFDPLVSTVWPPAGIALAALLLWGLRLLPGIAIGAFVTGMLLTGKPVAALGCAFGYAVFACLGHWLLRRNGFQPDFRRSRDVVLLLALGAAAAPVVSAIVGPAALLAADLIESGDFLRTASLWWVGDAVSVLLWTPFALTLRAALPRPGARRRSRLRSLSHHAARQALSGLHCHPDLPVLLVQPALYQPFHVAAANCRHRNGERPALMLNRRPDPRCGRAFRRSAVNGVMARHERRGPS